LGQNTPGRNFYLGYRAGQSTVQTAGGNGYNGMYNDFVGIQAGQANTTGDSNHFSGYFSGYRNTTGRGNLFLGVASGYNNTTGNYNQFIGLNAGFTNTSGEGNLFYGLAAGYKNQAGNSNTAIGLNSAFNNVTGNENTFLGYVSGAQNTAGNSNVFVGAGAGSVNTTGSSNTTLGYQADVASAGLTNATALGANAVVSQSNSLVLGNSVNVGIGTSAPTTRLEVVGDVRVTNAVVGTGADLGAVVGLGVRADGGLNLGQNTSGNMLLGYQAGQQVTTGVQNQFAGYQAGQASTTGNANTFTGFLSGYANSTGSYNSFSGAGSGQLNTGGSNNVFDGYQSGLSNQTGSNNTALGYKADVASGGLINATALGASAVVSQSNSLVLGAPGTSVGIGTGSPQARLEVQGGADSNGASDPVALALGYRTGGFRHWLRTRHNSALATNDNAVDVYLNNGSAAADSQPPGVLTAANPTGAGANTVQVLSLTQNAGSPRVGIGTVAPATTLDVAGPVRSSAGGFQFPDGTTQATAASGTGFIRNSTSSQAGASFNISGSGTIGGAAAIGGSLRLGVRLCPVNMPTSFYSLTAADIAYSLFKLTPAATVRQLELPAAGTGQTEGQELTIFNLTTATVYVGDTNTDSSTKIPLDAITTSGVHAVRFVWVVGTAGRQGSYWVRVQ
jgi:hypothetical protein